MRLGCWVKQVGERTKPSGFNEAEANAPRMHRGGGNVYRDHSGFNEAEANAPRMRGVFLFLPICF